MFFCFPDDHIWLLVFKVLRAANSSSIILLTFFFMNIFSCIHECWNEIGRLYCCNFENHAIGYKMTIFYIGDILQQLIVYMTIYILHYFIMKNFILLLWTGTLLRFRTSWNKLLYFLFEVNKLFNKFENENIVFYFIISMFSSLLFGDVSIEIDYFHAKI